jgi:serine/threonine protein kinase
MNQCQCTTKQNKRCRNKALYGERFCSQHLHCVVKLLSGSSGYATHSTHTTPPFTPVSPHVSTTFLGVPQSKPRRPSGRSRQIEPPLAHTSALSGGLSADVYGADTICGSSQILCGAGTAMGKKRYGFITPSTTGSSKVFPHFSAIESDDYPGQPTNKVCAMSTTACNHPTNVGQPAAGFSLPHVQEIENTAFNVQHERALHFDTPATWSDLFNVVTLDKVLSSGEKNSASDTVVCFGTMKRTGIKVALKMWVELDVKMYENVAKLFIAKYDNDIIKSAIDSVFRTKQNVIMDASKKQTHETRIYKKLSEVGPQPNIVRYINFLQIHDKLSEVETKQRALHDTVTLTSLSRELFNILPSHKNVQLALLQYFLDEYNQSFRQPFDNDELLELSKELVMENPTNEDLKQVLVDNYISKLDVNNQARWKEMLSNLFPDQTDFIHPTYAYVKHICVLVTERRQASSSLGAILEKPGITDTQLRSLIFQVLFAIFTTARHGIQHNDLHLGNVLVDLNPSESYIDYKVGDRIYRVNVGSTGKVLMFDWDLSYCKSCGKNTVVNNDLCSAYGICDSPNERFDIYTVLRDAYTRLENNMTSTNQQTIQTFKTFVEHVITDQHEEFAYRMCNQEPKKNICVPYPPGKPTNVATPLQAMLNEYFNTLRM